MQASPAQNLIAVIEDNPDIREGLIEILNDEGFRVLCYGNADEAFSGLRKTVPPPSLILLDLLLPGKTGQEFLSEKLADPVLRTVPVLVITASSVKDEAELASVAGVLKKPFDIESLVREVRRILSIDR